jgi:hypothetical protein
MGLVSPAVITRVFPFIAPGFHSKQTVRFSGAAMRVAFADPAGAVAEAVTRRRVMLHAAGRLGQAGA